MPRPALLLCLSLVACAGAPPEARRAEALLERGDYAGARSAADKGLERAPRDPLLWRLKMRALLGAGEARGAVALYRSWRDLRGQEDPAALRAMARTTLWQGLRARSAAIQTGAVQAIERLELEELSPEVAELVASEEPLVAAAAASALLTAHQNAPQVLVELLRSDDPAVRVLAVDGIGRKAGEHARADLEPMLNDRDARVRSAAAGAVVRFAEGAALVRLYTMARRDPDGPVRARILRGLATRDVDGRVELARQAATRDPYLGARHAAVVLLASTDTAEASAALDRLVRSRDLHIALAAAAERGGDKAVFERALADAAWTTRAAALNAVHAAPRPLALALAGRGIVDRRAEVRLAAARLFMRLEQPERARSELRSALAGGDALLRLDAAIDLLRLGDERGLAVLDRLAHSASPGVRGAAVRAHAAVGRTTAGLVAGLADPQPELRLAAAETLLALLDDDS
ncbi:MAG TPA: HEAT repeat domain-containing protein [Kofleriaceae bacterium]|nr:HEAT repeat domain-containing protein [Kofleriaceae bacterium]